MKKISVLFCLLIISMFLVSGCINSNSDPTFNFQSSESDNLSKFSEKLNSCRDEGILQPQCYIKVASEFKEVSVCDYIDIDKMDLSFIDKELTEEYKTAIKNDKKHCIAVATGNENICLEIERIVIGGLDDNDQSRNECLRDVAILNNDGSICDSITDSNYREICKYDIDFCYENPKTCGLYV